MATGKMRLHMATLRKWWNESCGLRFIYALYTVEGQYDALFERLIPQGLLYDDEEEDG